MVRSTAFFNSALAGAPIRPAYRLDLLPSGLYEDLVPLQLSYTTAVYLEFMIAQTSDRVPDGDIELCLIELSGDRVTRI